MAFLFLAGTQMSESYFPSLYLNYRAAVTSPPTRNREFRDFQTKTSLVYYHSRVRWYVVSSEYSEYIVEYIREVVTIDEIV